MYPTYKLSRGVRRLGRDSAYRDSRRVSLCHSLWRGVVCLFVHWMLVGSSAYAQTWQSEPRPQRLPAVAARQPIAYEPEYLNEPPSTLPSEIWIQEPGDSIDPVVPPKERAASEGGGMMGMGGGGNRSPLQYRTMWQPEVAVEGQATDFGLIQHDLRLMAPIWMADPHIVMATGGARVDLINTDAVLPDTGRAFPSELWNISLGLNYIRRFDNGRTGGVNLNIGSSSDQPFGAARDINFGAVAFLRVPHRERNAWNFVLVYAPLSQIAFPIPMASYYWQPSDEFSMNIGLPLQMTYRPTDRWTFDLSYMLLTTIHAQGTYQVNEQWCAYGAFDWQNQSWFLHDRQDDQERLFLYDKRFSVGLKGTVMKHVSVDLSTGYLFDRFYFTGENYDDKHHDRIEIGAGMFISAQAGLTW